jgi:hypothetical protein
LARSSIQQTSIAIVLSFFGLHGAESASRILIKINHPCDENKVPFQAKLCDSFHDIWQGLGGLLLFCDNGV